MSLIALTYVSVSARPMKKEELLDILEASRRNNQALDITGMLLYRDRFFIQVLEGEQAKVDALFEKVRQDKRHINILTVQKEPIKERSFTDWSMGFKNLDEVNPDEYEGLTDFLTKSVDESFFTDQPSRAKNLIYSFKKRM